jgi:hypothetical protein
MGEKKGIITALYPSSGHSPKLKNQVVDQFFRFQVSTQVEQHP